MDFYKILNVNKDSTQDEIKSAYRKLEFKYHPDRNMDNIKENENKFKDITEAYAVLSDSKKRKDYDLLVIQILIILIWMKKTTSLLIKCKRSIN